MCYDITLLLERFAHKLNCIITGKYAGCSPKLDHHMARGLTGVQLHFLKATLRVNNILLACCHYILAVTWDYSLSELQKICMDFSQLSSRLRPMLRSWNTMITGGWTRPSVAAPGQPSPQACDSFAVLTRGCNLRSGQSGSKMYIAKLQMQP